jgi:cytochrome b6-f complex iron-sulfur subunit
MSTETPVTMKAPLCAGLCQAPGVNRRAFLGAATLAALGALVEACSNPTGNFFNGSYGGPFTVTLASYPALATTGGVARVDGGNGAPTALVRTGTGSFTALSLVCPHQGFAPIDITGSGFYCPNHGSSFARTGAYNGGPAFGNLPSYATSYNATAGTVTVSRPS